jgi:predicted DNA-binding WGR domain protein
LELEARAPHRRCYRAYAINVAQDLFGLWLVELSYGRIGAAGRTKVRSFSVLVDANGQVADCLRKRATAPRRIGVAYEIVRSRNLGALSCRTELDLLSRH